MMPLLDPSDNRRRRHLAMKSFFRIWTRDSCSYVNPGEGMMIVLSSAHYSVAAFPIVAIQIPDDLD